ncbi:unnamed protein product, partial [Prorocentrum cordatum]
HDGDANALEGHADTFLERGAANASGRGWAEGQGRAANLRTPRILASSVDRPRLASPHRGATAPRLLIARTSVCFAQALPGTSPIRALGLSSCGRQAGTARRAPQRSSGGALLLLLPAGAGMLTPPSPPLAYSTVMVTATRGREEVRERDEEKKGRGMREEQGNGTGTDEDAGGDTVKQ